ncbi:hypothetical protein SADUNF_Sadunf16G0020700 [Salix dunnii]|uniref:Uncharacterized protein n=1 Tax=Salix dunnii TaxID=1413687 RepID=A0A835J7I7_9ROSI|nr:hypothetical protein SADUNF_Sadunf16G0020700 [Salix dunnii]
MSQNQATVAYPPPPASTGPSAYSSAPPPAGYPTKDGQTYLQNPVPVETKSRGDGFWKGWIRVARFNSLDQTELYKTVKYYRKRRATYSCRPVLLLCLGRLFLRIDGVS